MSESVRFVCVFECVCLGVRRGGGGVCTHGSSVLFNRGAVRWPTGNTVFVTSADESFSGRAEERRGATYITLLDV